MAESRRQIAVLERLFSTESSERFAALSGGEDHASMPLSAGWFTGERRYVRLGRFEAWGRWWRRNFVISWPKAS